MSHLKPIPQFDTTTDRRHQAPVFTAAAEDGDDYKKFSYEPHRPLCWWYRTPSGAWKHIPERGLVSLDRFGRIVRLNTEALEHPLTSQLLGQGGAQQQQGYGAAGPRAVTVTEYLVAVTEDEHDPPDD